VTAMSARVTNGQQADLRERGTGELVKQTLQSGLDAGAPGGRAGEGRGGGEGQEGRPRGGHVRRRRVAGLLTLGSLTACLILVLALAIPAWASALLITVLWAAVAGALALQGRNRLREMGKPVPEKTVETVKEDVQWLKNRR